MPPDQTYIGINRSREQGDFGAGEGNRTLVISLEGFCSTIELHPRRFQRGEAAAEYNIAATVKIGLTCDAQPEQ
jgi:hypothetical protein